MRCQSDKLNVKETRVYVVLRRRGSFSIGEIAVQAFPGMGHRPKTRGNSWVRNSLRKLVRIYAAEKVLPGIYKGTGKILFKKDLSTAV